MSDTSDASQQLQALMQQVGVPSFRALARQAGVSHWQVRQLRQGKALQMRVEPLLVLANVLQVTLSELLVRCAGVEAGETVPENSTMQAEYDRLQIQIQQQRETLLQEFQLSSLDILESWLRNWPTAAYAATQNPELPAVRLLPLLHPVERLLQEWGVEAIASVGSDIPYNPQQHQLREGMAEPGELVRVRSTGYRQGDKLLYRAEVSPIPNQG
ncbi:helix-turn-helix domain-containing protein [Laspinema palackyanum]|uniref:helix-turn-helix domain-containing protein n=1 Tax=Laspinema palackyanum TaxID=3231601 RepID=UPI00345DE730|nr:helix-turn-helix transcriptional regulator [Laspinema sp. D2c]